MTGKPDHVTERENGAVNVGRSRAERARDQLDSDDQLERIEAKLDVLMAELEVSE